MKILGLFLSVIILPASGVYNAYVHEEMSRDLPAAVPPAQGQILRGADPIIKEGRGEKAVLMIHGFNGSPKDFGRLPRMFQAKGYDVFAPLLPGHGRDPRLMAQATSAEWREYVSQAYLELRGRYREVVLMGISMGASLSIITAAEHADNPPDRLILMAPFLKVKQQWYYFLPVEVYHSLLAPFVPYMKNIAARCVAGPDKCSRPAQGYYQYLPTRAISEAFEVAREAREKISGVETPTLVLHSKKDPVTDYGTTRRLVKAAGGKNMRFLSLEKQAHVLPISKESLRTEEAVMEFIERPNE